MNYRLFLSLFLILGLASACTEAAEPAATDAPAATAMAEPAAPASDETAATAAEPAAAAPTYKEYTVSELVPVVNRGLRGGRDFERGKELFTALTCSLCHSFAGSSGGGVGPDLTGVGGRYGTRDILESIIDPSAVVSNLYGSYLIGLNDGRQITGKIMYEGEEDMAVAENVFDLTQTTMVKYADIAWSEESPYSLMPPGLINTSSEEDIVNLVAYLVSGGDPNNRMFNPADE